MDDPLLSACISALSALAIASLIFHWLRRLIRRRAEAVREQGYRLIHALNAYSAWIECQRDLPFSARSLDEMTSPEPLIIIRQIKRDWFPSIHPQVLRLLRIHNRMIEYLWQQSLLRLTQGTTWVPASDDPAYQQLRSEQEDLIDEMIDSCRRLTGDARRSWERTGSDFTFSNAFPRSGPAGRA